MRIKLAALALAIALLTLLPSSAKADTFVYNVTSTFENVDVTFEEPTFQETVTTATFTSQNTSVIGPVVVFSLSGDSTDCSASFGPGSLMVPGPCFGGIDSMGDSFEGTSLISPSFTGPGTFTDTVPGFTTTVTITDVPSGVPEPSSFLLLGGGLVSLLAMASFGTRIRRDSVRS